jgi:hypothetical protein
MEFIHREPWLAKFIELIRSYFAALGYPLPDKIRIACGYPSRQALRGRRQSFGECWPPEASEDGTVEIFINPYVSDPLEAAATALHELAHAAVGTEHGHRGPFKQLIRRLGLEGKPTSTYAGASLQVRLNALIEEHLGPYPHATLDGVRHRKTQGTRLIKCACPACGYTARITRRWIMVGVPMCPCGGSPMEPELDIHGEDEPSLLGSEPPASTLIDAVDPAESFSSRLTRHSAAYVLQRAGLTAQQRTMIHLRFMRSLSDDEIARHCGRSVQAIREAFGELTVLAAGGDRSVFTPPDRKEVQESHRA